MINLETARKLKDAGLEWEPKVNDFACFKDRRGIVRSVRWDEKLSLWVLVVDFDHHRDSGSYEYFTWLPRLDQLLAEIERQGWDWIMDKGSMTLYRDKEWGSQFFGVPDDAAANALLWILEREKVAHDVVHV